MNTQVETLKEVKIKNKLSNTKLSQVLGVSSSTVARWINGTTQMSNEYLELIKGLDEKKILKAMEIIARDDEHKVKSTNVKIKRKNYKLDFEPFVYNAPKDQHKFYDDLINSQITGYKTNPDYSRLALVKAVNGEETYLGKIIAPKPTAKQWNSNYGAHGWHRYIGRFPPHLVRSLINRFNLSAGDTLLDPFSGSGTTVLEARLLGLKGIGVDICPLSTMLAEVKSKFPKNSKKLIGVLEDYLKFYDQKHQNFLSHKPKYTHEDIINRKGNLVDKFTNYNKWFTKEALLGVSITVEFINSLKGYNRKFVSIALSSAIRTIGNVDVDVVRAEYSKAPRKNVDVKTLVKKKFEKMLKDILKMQDSHSEIIGSPSDINVIEGSLLKAKIPNGSIDAVITSPPYGVESISYLRTHLLSYRSLNSFLNMSPYSDHKDIIGSEFLDSSKDDEIWNASEYSGTFYDFFKNKVGDIDEKKFVYRKNMMMKFFSDMAEIAENFQKWLKKGGHVAFVIGNKKIGDHVIPTHSIIVETFKSCGFTLEESICHKLKTNNSNSQVPWQERIIEEEYILIFKK